MTSEANIANFKRQQAKTKRIGTVFKSEVKTLCEIIVQKMILYSNRYVKRFLESIVIAEIY
jgi:hypothetical protein